ncbi:hypothetical protein CQW23_04569 [Capsicum baccatum]|uniref:Calmodulin-binding domain-containing protein n=1 Tax=Capsicum baccatum TaxID=33114 RepID=A0A2G2XF09_CAPBA|nr:hypothetical protein CQW23_04569 [Capsicum baccatum]
MTRKAPKQTRAHQKQLDILSPTCAVYELRCLCLQYEMQVPIGDVITKYVLITSILFADCGGLEEIDLQATKLHEFECSFNNRVRFYFSSVPVLEHVKISLHGDASMSYIFGEFAANLPAQVKSLIVTTWNTQVTHFQPEMQIFRNPGMLVLLFESTYNFDIVKVSPVLDVCPVLQSLQILGSGMMAEYNSDELASPVTSVKNDSMAEDNTDELVSPVTSVKNDSIDEDNINELVSPVASVKNDSAGTKPWHPLSKRKNKLPTDEQSPVRTLVGEAKKGTLVKQKLSTPPGSVLGEKKKVTGVEKKPSTSPGSMLGEAKKRTVVMQKTFTTSRSSQSDAKKGIFVKQKLSTPPVNMLEEGKKVNEVYQKPLSPRESELKDKKEVTMVEQKPSSPSGCMEGGIDEVTMVGKSLQLIWPSPKVHSLEPFKIKKKKILLTPKSVHSLKLDSSSVKMPETEKKMKSSSKILGGVDAETVGKNQKKILTKGKTSVSNDNNSSKVKMKFRRGKIVDLQQETSSPRRLTFRWGRHVGESQDSNTRKRIFKKKGVDGDKVNTIPISGKIILRHQDMQQKKDVQGLLNNVIEETTSKLVEIGKSKVKALVGDFETVISLHNKPSIVIVS